MNGHRTVCILIKHSGNRVEVRLPKTMYDVRSSKQNIQVKEPEPNTAAALQVEK